jgi:hypothetical protein
LTMHHHHFIDQTRSLGFHWMGHKQKVQTFNCNVVESSIQHSYAPFNTINQYVHCSPSVIHNVLYVLNFNTMSQIFIRKIYPRW